MPSFHIASKYRVKPNRYAAMLSMMRLRQSPREDASIGPECVNVFETSFGRECYAAIALGGLMNTVAWSAGGSGVPFTNRFELRACAA